MDGASDLEEHDAGTNPADPLDRPMSWMAEGHLHWEGLTGKEYRVLRGTSPGALSEVAHIVSGGGAHFWLDPDPLSVPAFYAVEIVDTQIDSDGDGVLDSEEALGGTDPHNPNSDRYGSGDYNRLRHASDDPNEVELVLMRDEQGEDWPFPNAVGLRRISGLGAVLATISWSGSATQGVDYGPIATTLTLASGEMDTWLSFDLIDDQLAESEETITVTLTNPADGHFSISGTAEVTLRIKDDDTTSQPDGTGIRRFLTQSTFGPTEGLVSSVNSLGFASWIETQFTLPVGAHAPLLQARANAGLDVYSPHKSIAWWEQVMTAQDPLRQWVAYALSQILVISDVGALDNEPIGMMHYYDRLLEHSFGNYRDLLMEVSLHPCMGIYLSHMKNLPPDEDLGRFPDENYAREIMQLFSIGLWELNPDGSQKLGSDGEPIPTYSNEDITQYARVFTGLSWGGPLNDPTDAGHFHWGERDFSASMHMYDGAFSFWNPIINGWDIYYLHDRDEKVLIDGTVLPANQSGMADVEAAIDSLFLHPNTGPFICRQLIQRMVTSNPSPGYVQRVASAFADNGSGVRGDMKAVVRAILLDTEARDMSRVRMDAHGKLREPYLRYVAMGRAFEASAPSNRWELAYLGEDFGQEPLQSPSVFNFYMPDHSPNGLLGDAGLLGPEFQITTDVTATSVRNRFYRGVFNFMNRWTDDPANEVTLNLTQVSALSDQPDRLVQFVAERLAGNRLSVAEHAIVAAAVNRVTADDTLGRAQIAVYLIATSPASAILK
jgi:uncharacterized protein (DUF1800 family)